MLQSIRTVTATFFLCFVCLAAIEAKTPEPSPARFTVKVVDEDGRPVPNVPVSAGFVAEEKRDISGATDSNGIFAAECEKVMSGEAGFSIDRNLAAYYPTYAGLRLTKIINGRWEPWNPVITAVVRRIVTPIPMYVKRVETKIQTTNQCFGYDLAAGDWATPEGRGSRSDLVFRVNGYWNNHRDNDSVLTLSFSRAADGVREDPFKATGSSFTMSRMATNEGYRSSIQWRKARAIREGIGNDVKVDELKEAPGYLFRIRSETNEVGVLTNACYGKIHPGIEFGGAGKDGCYLKFTYYLNPAPNDRNLEFDPKRNLFKDLKSTEQVREP